jgi:hypothetical protein
MRGAGHMLGMRRRELNTEFSGKPDGNRPLRRLSQRWNNNIEMVWEDTDLMHVAEDGNKWLAFMNTVMNFHIA